MNDKEGITMNDKEVALTTIDNPYDPFNAFDQWYLFDMDNGYCTCGYVDRIAQTSDQLSDIENDRELERAIDEIIKYDFLNIYKKVYNNSAKVS